MVTQGYIAILVATAKSNQAWQSDMTKIWVEPAVGWDYPLCVIRCFIPEIVGWNLPHRCQTEDAVPPV